MFVHEKERRNKAMTAREKNIKWFSVILSLFFILGAATGIAGDVPDSADQVKPLEVGDKLPQATLMTGEGKPFDLNAAIAKRPAVLVFYRGRW